jgi:intracellular multiplication protein IcmO
LLTDLDERIGRVHEIMSTEGEDVFQDAQEEGEEIQVISDAIVAQEDGNPIERALGALMAFHNRHAEEDTYEDDEVVEEDDGRLNLFSKVKLGDFVQTLVGGDEMATFSQPLLIKSVIKDKVELIERLLGRPSSQAGPMPSEIIKDLALATDYPPAIEGVLLPEEEVVTLANELCDYVTSLKDTSQDEEI